MKVELTFERMVIERATVAIDPDGDEDATFGCQLKQLPLDDDPRWIRVTVGRGLLRGRKLIDER